MRFDNVRDILTSFLCKVCKDVQSEPHLIPLENEVLHLNTANRSEEPRLDIKAKWILGTWPNVILRYQSYACERHVKQKQEHQGNLQKSRTCQETRIHGSMERVLEVERGTFTPLVMGTNEGMGDECSRFLSQLANKLAAKQNESYNTVIAWIRTKLSYEILRSAALCVRGSRTPYKSGQR